VTKQNATGCNQAGKAPRGKRAAGKPEQLYLVAGDKVLSDKLIGGADVVIDADAGHSFNPGFKFQSRRADAPQVQPDLEYVCLLRPVNSSRQEGNVVSSV